MKNSTAIRSGTSISRVCGVVYGLADEWPAAKVVSANYVINGEPAGTRTQGPRLKRAMLYRLSYRLTEQRGRILPPTFGLCLAGCKKLCGAGRRFQHPAREKINRLPRARVNLEWIAKHNGVTALRAS